MEVGTRTRARWALRWLGALCAIALPVAFGTGAAAARADVWGAGVQAQGQPGPVQAVTFDERNRPWLAVKESSTSLIARLTRTDALLGAMRVSPPPGAAAVDVQALAVSASGTGEVLLWAGPAPHGLLPELGEEASSYDLAPWHPGRPPGRATLLTAAATEPTLLTGSRGTAVALWRTDARQVTVADIRGGRVAAVRQLPPEPPCAWEVEATAAGRGFLASWPACGSGPGTIGVDTAAIGSDGGIGRPAFAPWTGPRGTEDRTAIATDARGGQVAVWEEAAGEGQPGRLWLASRRPGGSFTRPRLLASAAAPWSYKPAIAPSGVYAVLFSSAASGQLLVTGGRADASAATVRQLWSGPRAQGGDPERVAVTTRGRILLTWNADDTSAVAGARIMASSTADGVTFAAPTTISSLGSGVVGCQSVSLLVPDRRGGALAVMPCQDAGLDRGVEEYARFRP